MIALLLSFLVVLALGRLILMNQASWAWGQDKAVLQQNITESLEWMARSIRAARSLEVLDVDAFRTFDETGNLAHSYELDTVDGVPKLLQDGTPLVDRECTNFVVEANPDTTSLTLTLELLDGTGTAVEGVTRATMRNVNYEIIVEN